jgi:nucleoid DNA-binding protein
MAEQRKLKPLNQRKPERCFYQHEMAKELCEKTGFRKEDVLLVLQEYGRLAREKVCQGYKVYFSGMGTIYPKVRVGRYSYILQYKYGGDGMGKEQFVPKMDFGKPFKAQLKAIEVPKELLEFQYEDELKK